MSLGTWLRVVVEVAADRCKGSLRDQFLRSPETAVVFDAGVANPLHLNLDAE
jgi:hypothetical protein